MDNPQARLVDLEMKLAFLERTVEELSEVVLGQGKELERLERRVRELGERMTTKGDGTGDAEADPLQERPPHY
jgi:SlyX protein